MEADSKLLNVDVAIFCGVIAEDFGEKQYAENSLIAVISEGRFEFAVKSLKQRVHFPDECTDGNPRLGTRSVDLPR